MSDSLLHQIALTKIPLIGAITAKTLVSYCGSAEGVFHASKKELFKIPGIGEVLVRNILDARPDALAEQEVDFLTQHRIHALFYTDERFPTRLRQCNDSPALVYFKGSDLALLNAARMVAVVGTRQPTEHGRAICEEIVEGLKPYNVMIISGLAYGVDVTAHRKASACGLPNIGVLGHGLSTIYPNDHRSVALKMLEHGGLLTEFTSQTKPDRENFPMRNRIIAGMCDALLVVESGASGGSMITAELAHQYGRDLFAIPGRIRDAKSAGCNVLIKSERARLVENVSDLAAAMMWSQDGRPKPIQTKLFHDLSPIEKTVLDLIIHTPEIAIDQIANAVRLPPGELATHVLSLEFKGLIKTLPGKRYVAL